MEDNKIYSEISTTIEKEAAVSGEEKIEKYKVVFIQDKVEKYVYENATSKSEAKRLVEQKFDVDKFVSVEKFSK